MKKLKRLANPVVGSKCVVTQATDATIYTIDHIYNRSAKLVYHDGPNIYSGGVLPLACLYEVPASMKAPA